MSVIKKAKSLLMLSEAAKGRMNALLSNSLQTLETEVSSSIYVTYNSLPDDADPYLDDANTQPNPAYIAYDLLTDNQKIRRNLETAQAYFLLYHTVVSNKEINVRNVMLSKATSGDGSLNPSDMDEIASLRNMLFTNGQRMCSNYKTTGDMTIIIC